jgi:hypothetical protein
MEIAPAAGSEEILGIEIAHMFHSTVYIIVWNRRKQVHKMFMTSW